MKNFNLLISTSRYNETNAKAELWFTLLMCGDKYPIISTSNYPGLITALSNIEAKEIIIKIKEILKEDPHFFQYILKILPIDFICELKIQTIKKVVEDNYKKYINDGETFAIHLKRRKNEQIRRDLLIETVARKIENKVNLNNPNKIILIELLGNICGISFIKKEDIVKVNR